MARKAKPKSDSPINVTKINKEEKVSTEKLSIRPVDIEAEYWDFATQTFVHGDKTHKVPNSRFFQLNTASTKKIALESGYLFYIDGE